MKKRKKIQNKKSIIFITIVFLLATIGGTIAYMMGRADFRNDFATKKFDVGLEEEFYGTWGTKKVRIVNREDDNVSVLLRISFNEKWEHNGKILSNFVMYQDVVDKIFPSDFETNFVGHVAHGDGWYYYTKEFKGGDEVAVLEGINLNTGLLRRSPDLEEYLASDYTLTVNYETILYDEALAREKWGVDLDINGSNVSYTQDPN